jgi:NRE family putative nickel resistance protein-like MFS transporter
MAGGQGVLEGGATGYGALVRGNDSFRMLWLGQIVSLLGDWFNLIASASLVGQLTDSGLAVGALFVVRMVAPFLVSPVAGVAADRYSRQRLLILADLGRAVTVFGFLLVRDAGDIWLLYLLTAIQLSISGFFFPARNAILPDIVGDHELGAANALSSATWSVMLAFGAALGGVVAGGWGIYPAFVIDGLTFLISALFISRIDYAPSSALAEAEKTLRAALRQYVAGLRYLAQHVDILAISLHKAAFALAASGALQVIQVELAEQVFVIGEGGGTSLGLMYAVSGIGTGLGPILARRFTGDRDRSLRVALAVSYAVAALGLLIMAPLRNFYVVLLGTLLRSAGGGIGWVFSTQLLLQLLPGYVRGRVFSSEFALFTLLNAVGTAAGGWALDAQAITLSDTFWWMTGLTLVPGLLWTLWIFLHPPTPRPPAATTAVEG